MTKGIPKIKEFPSDNRFWRVDWFGAVQRNPKIPSEPYIRIIISPLVLPDIRTENAKSLAAMRAVNYDEQKIISIGCGQLPLISIGSIWRNGICQRYYAGEQLTLPQLSITSASTRVIEAGYKEHDINILPYTHYRVSGAGIRSKLLAVEHNQDPFSILIPMMELIRFYYAVSTDLAHAIFSGALKHDINSILNMENTGNDPSEDRAIIGLRQHLTDEDGWILARMMNSAEAWHGATLIHDSMLKNALNSHQAYIETCFPFNGQTTLQARCKRIPTAAGGWRTLVLALDYCTAPFPFTNLTIDRDNDNRPDGKSSDEEKKPAFQGTRPSKETDGQKALQSQQEANKDLSTETITVPTSRFAAIEGKKPDKPIKDECHYKSSPTFVQKSGEDLSTGDGAYNDSTVSQAKVNSTYQRQKALPASFDTFIEAIEHLNRLDGFSARLRAPNEYTEYIPLTGPSGKWQWSYLDSKTRTRRQILIADINYQGHNFSLIEFEQRETDKCRIGMAYFDDGRYISDTRITMLLSGIAENRGVWGNIPDYKLGSLKIDSYKHVWPSAETFSASTASKIKAITPPELTQSSSNS